MRKLSLLAVSILLAASATACGKKKDEPGQSSGIPPLVTAPAPGSEAPTAPAGLYDPPPSADNPQTPEKIALGKQLFFDTRLSKDGSTSCEGCHYHDKGWTDGLALSTKVGGAVNTRHTPTLYNVAYQNLWYWDGRATTLEGQVVAAWKGQMGADPAVIASALEAIPGYKEQFQKVFNEPASEKTISMALAAYLRTLLSGGSAWDRFEAGDKTAVSADAIEGYKLFTAKAQCVLCHIPPLYTDMMFHNVGLEAGKPTPDVGRFKISNDPKDTSAFKTASLRTVAKSGPYFHDGSQPSLEEAVRYMAGGGKPDPNLDPRLKPANLNDQEIKQVVAFLMALGDTPDKLEKPKLP